MFSCFLKFALPGKRDSINLWISIKNVWIKLYNLVFIVYYILQTVRYRQKECYSKLYFQEKLSFGFTAFAMDSHRSKPSLFASHQSFHLFLFYCLVCSTPEPFHSFTVSPGLLPKINHLTRLTYRVLCHYSSFIFLH